MSFRPEWYQDRSSRPGGLWGMGDWSGFRVILTITGAFWAIEFLAGTLFGGSTPLASLMALRAWNITDANELSFNLLFPLQCFTYMLQHAPGLSHIGWNMFFLYLFGRELEAFMGKDAFLRLYVVGGFVGGLVQWAVAVVTHDPTPVVGASAAVYSVMVLYVLRWPRRTIFLLFPPIPLPAALLVGIKVLGDIGGAFAGATGTAHFAHLGGALMGLVWWKSGDFVGRFSMRRKRTKAEKQSQKHEPDRREMDRILAKIQAQGLGSLTSKERAYLDRRSRELREQQKR
ncbi:MAG: rhomboid family intramembrane serine protease [Planctomycetes bacterium]|nr:rhomboid family intramembrane serine protease [Planctomycetota bacterium]